jgi:cytochrome c oxidase subunit 2
LASLPIPAQAYNWHYLFKNFFFFGFVGGIIAIGLMIYLAHQHRHLEGKSRAPPIDRIMEAVIAAAISTVLLISLNAVSSKMTYDIQYPPPVSESLVINVTAFQWAFKFTYPNGVATTGEFNVPSGVPVIFRVTSTDVYHDFGLPDFRVKIDAIPGVTNTLWILPPALDGQEELQYEFRCYELCGVGHTYMGGIMHVMNQNAFYQWLNSQGGGS